MPSGTYYQPIESILDAGICEYEYYSPTENKFDKDKKTRICHVELQESTEYNKDIVLLIFTIRNQNGTWKIHSEGEKRTDAGAMIPMRNAAIKLAKGKRWKYAAIATANSDVESSDIISKYVVSIESYTYGKETVCPLTDELNSLKESNYPDFLRKKITINNKEYSLAFIKKEKLLDYLKYIDNRAFCDYYTNLLKFQTDINIPYERNRIVFGAPGTGKSFKLKLDCKRILTDFNGEYERVTFHPDYTYSNFVGTYKPVMGDDGETIKYDYVPGPFMRVLAAALKNALTDEVKPYLLIIEEINRAKVSAVFGEVFQLLDRDSNGISEYEIQASEDMKKYLCNEIGGNPSNYSKLKIPNNMFIWATMNSADQGVFPMDTAFKRRWNFEYIGINDNEEEIKGKVSVGSLRSQEISWNVLRKAINEKLSRICKVNEDKLMGPFFLANTIIKTISDTDDTIADTKKFTDAFKSKVIMYLFEDAAKQYRNKLFEGCEDTTKYSAICDSFDEIGIEIFGNTFETDFYDSQKG